MRTVCAHEELLRGGFSKLGVYVHYSISFSHTPLCLLLADLCRDQYSRCGVAALTGQCASLGGSCGKSCGGC